MNTTLLQKKTPVIHKETNIEDASSTEMNKKNRRHSDDNPLWFFAMSVILSLAIASSEYFL